jgi:hypothetical protein
MRPSPRFSETTTSATIPFTAKQSYEIRRPRDPDVAICCAQHMATYVALRTMLRMGSGARRASDCLRAEHAPCEPRRFRSLVVSATYFRLGCYRDYRRCGSTTSRSTRRACTSRPARNSSDVRSIAHWAAESPCLAAGATEPRSRVPRSLQPAQPMLRRKPDPLPAAPTFDRGQHISVRNIGRQRDGPVWVRWNDRCPGMRSRRPLPAITVFSPGLITRIPQGGSA